MGEADNYYNPNQQGYGYQQPPPQQQPYGGQQYNGQQYNGQQYGGPNTGYQPEYTQQQPPMKDYQQGQQPPPGPGYNGYGGETGQGEKQSFEQTFKIEKPKWNDLWAGILFILVFLGFAAVSGITLHAYAATGNVNNGGITGGDNTFSLSTNTVILFAFVVALAVILSFIYLALARLFPKQFIWITGILNIIFAVGTAAYYFYRRYWSYAIFSSIYVVLLCFAFYTWISRIPFSALMLKTSISISKNYGHTYMVSFIGGILSLAFGAWYGITLVGIYTKYQPAANNPGCNEAGGGCSSATLIGLIVFVTFAMYWISEWIKNTIHTTISGVYGSWYFRPNDYPKGVTRGAAKRALTYSFGSICLGSLLVAIVQFLRQVCSMARASARSEGGVSGMIGYVIFLVLGCFIALLDWAIQFLNRYAFCHIALYGKAYIPAAKDTWKMIKDRGIDALVNECLIGPVLSIGSIFIGLVCGLLGYLYLQFTDPAYNNEGQYTPVVVAFSTIIGLQISLIVTTPLSSGIETIFVAAGWDPMVLYTEHPELYGEMVKVYPKVQQVIQDR